MEKSMFYYLSLIMYPLNLSAFYLVSNVHLREHLMDSKFIKKNSYLMLYYSKKNISMKSRHMHL